MSESPSGGYNPLSPEEEFVLLRKGTERPFIGEYTGNKQPGTYICRRCNADEVATLTPAEEPS